MRPALILLPLAVLAACATPREQCIDQAQRDARVLAALVAETEGNLARGFALETEQEVRTLRRTCQGRTDEGVAFSYRCDDVRTFEREVPVAIDLDAERSKLQSLRERLASEQTAANAAVAQCIATYPE